MPENDIRNNNDDVCNNNNEETNNQNNAVCNNNNEATNNQNNAVCNNNNEATNNQNNAAANENFRIRQILWTPEWIERLSEELVDEYRQVAPLTDKRATNLKLTIESNVSECVNNRRLTLDDGEVIRNVLPRNVKDRRLRRRQFRDHEIVTQKVNDFVETRCAQNTEWTEERAACIRTIAEESVNAFANGAPMVLTDPRRNRILTIVSEEAAFNARKDHPLTPELIVTMKNWIFDSFQLFKNDRRLEVEEELVDGLRTLIEHCVDVAVNGLVTLPYGLIDRITTYVYRDFGVYARQHQMGWTDEQIGDMRTFVCERVSENVVAYQTWTPALIEDIRTIVCESIEDCANERSGWTEEAIAQTQAIASTKIDGYAEQNAETLTQGLVEKIRGIANGCIDLYAREHFWDLSLNHELQEKFKTYLTRFAGVLEEGEEPLLPGEKPLLPLWNSLQDFEQEDKETLLGNFVAALKHHSDYVAEQIPERTLDFLQQRGWAPANLSLAQVAECIYHGCGFTGGGNLAGNLFYDLALHHCIKRSGINGNAYAAFRVVCEQELYAVIRQKLGSGDEVRVENAYHNFMSKIIDGTVARKYKGDSGLARCLLGSFFDEEENGANNWQGNWDDVQDNQELEQDDQILGQDDQNLYEQIRQNIDEELTNLTAEERRIYALHLGWAWSGELGVINEEARRYNAGETPRLVLNYITESTSKSAVELAEQLGIPERRIQNCYKKVRDKILRAFIQALEECEQISLLQDVKYYREPEARGFCDAMKSLATIANGNASDDDNFNNQLRAELRTIIRLQARLHSLKLDNAKLQDENGTKENELRMEINNLEAQYKNEKRTSLKGEITRKNSELAQRRQYLALLRKRAQEREALLLLFGFVCSGAETCVEAETCDRAASCDRFKMCQNFKTCSWVSKCDRFRMCGNFQACDRLATCQNSRACDRRMICNGTKICDNWKRCDNIEGCNRRATSNNAGDCVKFNACNQFQLRDDIKCKSFYTPFKQFNICDKLLIFNKCRLEDCGDFIEDAETGGCQKYRECDRFEAWRCDQLDACDRFVIFNFNANLKVKRARLRDILTKIGNTPAERAWKDRLGQQWRNRLGNLYCNGNIDITRGVGKAIGVWLECVDRIDRNTGEYQPRP